MQKELCLKVIGEPLTVQEKKVLVEVQQGLTNAINKDDFQKLLAIYKEIADRYEV